jgi:hypothetical protein
MVSRLNAAGWHCTEHQNGFLKLRHAEKPGELIVEAPPDCGDFPADPFLMAMSGKRTDGRSR